MSQWVPFAGVFLGGTVTTLVVLLLWRRWRAPERDRFAREDADGEPDRRLVLGSLTTALSEQIPLTKRGRTNVQQELRAAGFYRPTALTEYAAVRAVMALMPLLVAGVFALLAPPAGVPRILIVGFIAAGLGYSLPRLYLAARARARARQIERALPLAIDLLTMCLSAGQDLLASLQQVSRELERSSPVLARELAIACRQAELHSLEHAMKQWADRVRVPEVTNLALLLIQSERLGTDAATTLSELATNFRVTMRQRAEAHANRTSFWMLFPSVFCFWVAAAIVLVGPPYLEFFQHRQRSAQIINQSRKNINQANERNRRFPNRVPVKPGEVVGPGMFGAPRAQGGK